jgi:DNA-binding CsgD family transcriptional regulator
MLAPPVGRGERADFWLDLVASLCASRLDDLPHAVVAGALTASFEATATAVHIRRGDQVTQSVHGGPGPADRWEEANRFARTRAATEHPLLAYYLATGDDRAHDLDGIPRIPDRRPCGAWREQARALAADRQIAIPLIHAPPHHHSYVVGRSEPFAPEDLWFARRLQGLLRGLARQVVATRGVPADPADEVGLTPRETAALVAVAEGLTADAVARRLGISPRTVHKHLERAYAKLGVRDRVSAVLRAGRLGLLPTTAGSAALP